MSTPSENVVGAPGVITLGGKDYAVAAATDRTLLLVRRWVQSRLRSPIAAVAAELDSLPPAHRTAALQAAASVQASGSIVTDEAAMEHLMSVDGVRWLAWQHMMPPVNPDLTRAALDALVTEDNLLDTFLALDAATGMSELVERVKNPAGRTG